MPTLFRRALVLAAIAAFSSATVGADLVDLLTCAGEAASGCGSEPTPSGDSEGACDHCPSCLVAHGHMQPILAGSIADARSPKSSRLASTNRLLHTRLAVQEIFHPPIAPAV